MSGIYEWELLSRLSRGPDPRRPVFIHEHDSASALMKARASPDLATSIINGECSQIGHRSYVVVCFRIVI